MCAYLSDPECSGKTGMRQLIVVKAVKDRQWLNAKGHLRGSYTKKKSVFAKQLCRTVLTLR